MWHAQQTKDSLNKGLINVICHIRSVRIVYISDFCPTHAACLIHQRLFLLSFPPFLTGPLEFHLWCDELWVNAASCANIELLQPAPFSPWLPSAHYSHTSPQLESCKSKLSSLLFLLGGGGIFYRPNSCSASLSDNFGKQQVWGNGFFSPG